jgi:hypothetical protein
MGQHFYSGINKYVPPGFAFYHRAGLSLKFFKILGVLVMAELRDLSSLTHILGESVVILSLTKFTLSYATNSHSDSV